MRKLDDALRRRSRLVGMATPCAFDEEAMIADETASWQIRRNVEMGSAQALTASAVSTRLYRCEHRGHGRNCVRKGYVGQESRID